MGKRLARKMSPNKFLESLFVFRLTHQDEQPDSKQLSEKQRMNHNDELKEWCRTVGSALSFADYVVRAAGARLTSHESDMKCWE